MWRNISYMMLYKEHCVGSNTLLRCFSAVLITFFKLLCLFGLFVMGHIDASLPNQLFTCFWVDELLYTVMTYLQLGFLVVSLLTAIICSWKCCFVWSSPGRWKCELSNCSRTYSVNAGWHSGLSSALRDYYYYLSLFKHQ